MTGPDTPEQPNGPWYIWPSRLGSCKGNIMMDTLVSRTRPELFVPQGITSRVWNPAITAGTWPCHEKSGGGCGDVTRQPWPGPGGIAPLTPAERARTCEAAKPGCLPSNPLILVNSSNGTTSWSKRGRYRDGGAIAFGGGGSHGRLAHTAEYDFRNNSHFFNITNEFTLQLTIHPIGPTIGRVQVPAPLNQSLFLATHLTLILQGDFVRSRWSPQRVVSGAWKSLAMGRCSGGCTWRLAGQQRRAAACCETAAVM